MHDHFHLLGLHSSFFILVINSWKENSIEPDLFQKAHHSLRVAERVNLPPNVGFVIKVFNEESNKLLLGIVTDAQGSFDL